LRKLFNTGGGSHSGKRFINAHIVGFQKEKPARPELNDNNNIDSEISMHERETTDIERVAYSIAYAIPTLDFHTQYILYYGDTAETSASHRSGLESYNNNIYTG